MYGLRLGWGMGLLAALAVLWIGSRYGSDPVAAAIRATEAAQAWHHVATLASGSVREGWFLLGVGSYERQVTRGGATEEVVVDDGRHRYIYKPGKREVEVWPTEIGDRTEQRHVQEHLTGSGLLKELQRHVATQSVQVQDVVVGDRRLRLISAAGDMPRVYVGPETDRVVLVETVPGGRLSRIGFRRMQIDYPDPASIDRARFRFEVPPGVSVRQCNYILQPMNSSEPGMVCSWRMMGLKKAFIEYLHDHHGQWPAALRPDLDPYVGDVGVFRCPLDKAPAGEPTSYVYHRPAAPVDPVALEERWNANNTSPPETSDRLGKLVECRLHPGMTQALYLDGRVMGGVIGKAPAARR